jgi:hypothetical protein
MSKKTKKPDWVIQDKAIIDKKLRRFKQRLLNEGGHYTFFQEYYSLRIYLVDKTDRKRRDSQVKFQAQKLGINVKTFYRLLNSNYGADPRHRKVLSEATGTPETLWERGGSPDKRKAAINKWWAKLEDKDAV